MNSRYYRGITFASALLAASLGVSTCVSLAKEAYRYDPEFTFQSRKLTPQESEAWNQLWNRTVHNIYTVAGLGLLSTVSAWKAVNKEDEEDGPPDISYLCRKESIRFDY